MPPISSDAIVLRTFKLGESSKIVVLLTRERGKLRAVAKGARGARPRYQSALEPLSEVRVSLYGRQGTELFRLGECELVRSAFRAGARGLDEAMSLSYFAELLDAFAQEGEAEDAVYRLALAIVAAVDGGTETGMLGRYLEAWLLKLHGIYPPLDRCAGCDATLPAGERRYHRPAHGFVCEACGPRPDRSSSPWTTTSCARRSRAPPASPGVPHPWTWKPSTAISSAPISSATCTRIA